MTDYVDVFGGATVSPANSSFEQITLTTSASFNWPYNYSGDSYVISKIMEITCSNGVVLTLPTANQVSPGEDFIIRNVGANALTIVDSTSGAIATISAGAASYLYVVDNSTEAGTWGLVAYGVGSSSVDAATLSGFGVQAIGTTLNLEHEHFSTAAGMTITSSYRSKVINFTGGAETITFDSSATLGDGFFVMIRNSGTGTLTLDPNSSETIDGVSTMIVQPGESAIVACSGSALFTIGYGRSTLYQFTQLTKDVSAGGTITLSSAEASNKLLTFVGSPAADLTVVVPAIVSVYYVFNNISTSYSVTVKTASGTGTAISQTQRAILFCDGTNVYAAQSTTVTSSISLVDGSNTNPALNFASKTNSGIYKSGSQDIGVAVNGANVATITSTGINSTAVGATTASTGRFTTVVATTSTTTPTIGVDADSQHTLPNVAADTFTLNAATQTLTNKTISVDNNTVSGIAASSFVLSDASGNINGAAAQKAIPSGVVVGTTDTQTLTNKTLTNPTLNVGSGTLVLPQTTTPAQTAEGSIVWDSDNDILTIGDGTNRKTFSHDAVTRLETMWIPAGAMTPQFTNGPSVGITELTNDVMLQTLDFDAVTEEFAQFEVRMPKSWDESTVTFMPVWSHAATTTNFGVVWALSGYAFTNDDALDVSFTGGITSADTGGTTNDLYHGPVSSAYTILGTPASEDTIKFRVSRVTANASDTMAIDARLHGIVLLYNVNNVTDA
jgi:hypothetical protein